MPRFRSNLTPRQLEVGRLICEGFTTAKIAERLQLSQSTVDVHRVAIRLKLQVHNTSQLMATMIAKKLWCPPNA